MFDVIKRLCGGRTIERPSKIPSVQSESQRPRGHRRTELIMPMRLEYTKLLPDRVTQVLAERGIDTCAELLAASLDDVRGTGLTPRQVRRLRAMRKAIRLAASVDLLSLREAVLLVRVHRTNLYSLACDNASVIHHDLIRFANSSRGRRYLGGRGIPSLRRVKRWVYRSRQTLESRGSTTSLVTMS